MKIIKNCYRILYLLIGMSGLLILFGVFQGKFSYTALVYYTVQSNILCLLYMGLRLFYDNSPLKKDTSFGRFILSGHTKYYITMCILLTFLIYHFLLAPTIGKGPNRLVPEPVSNTILHYIIPVMTLIDFLVFDKKGQTLSLSDPFKWMIIPFTYLIFIILRAPLFGNIGTTSSPYPYRFIDFSIQPISAVLTHIFYITLIFIILGYLLLFVDYLIRKYIPFKARVG
ncbi:MAG: Pr6Pr family membrane protein [Candidatus Azobacteroides sp.]|nr:Pr6Pr family membrane protein [Candidatus Azobacteroides sp.]